MKVRSWVRIIATGEVRQVTRIDNHVYPICAGYRRFKAHQLEIIQPD